MKKKNKNKLSWSGLVKTVKEVCEMSKEESSIVTRALVFKWKEKSDFENEVSEMLGVVREEIKTGQVEVEDEEKE